LKARRPDLWTLPLTCDNTNTLVAYLDIINPTLENYIALQFHGYKGALRDRNHIETIVYQQILATSHRSFSQPFTLALEEIDTYLEHFGVSRLQIVRALGAPQPVIAQAALKISAAVYRQLMDSNTDHGVLKDVYGIEFHFAGSGGHVSALNVQDLMRPTGFSRADVELAAGSHFVTKNALYKVRIHSERRNAQSVQNDVEKISGLNADALNRLYRFTRLHGATPWSVAELDLILRQLETAGLAAGIDADALSRVAQLLDLRHRWSLPADQLCTLWSPIPTFPAGISLFDRLFNFAPLAQADGALPKPTLSFVHGAYSGTGTAAVISTSPTLGTPGVGIGTAAAPAHAEHTLNSRLLAGLGVSDTDLFNLITALAGPVGAEVSNSSASQRGFALSLANLTLLYRHSLLARLLNVRVTDLFQLIQLSGLANAYVGSMDDLIALLAFYDWVQTSGYSPDDLGTITHGTVQLPASYPDPSDLAQKMVTLTTTTHALEFADRVLVSLLGVTEAESQQMIADNGALFELVPNSPTGAFRLTPALMPGTALQFDDTVLAFLPGISEAQSQQVIAANPTLFQSVGGTGTPMLELTASFGPQSTLTIPAGIDLDPALANQALSRYSGGAGGAAAALLIYHPLKVVPSCLAGLLNIDAGKLTQLQAMLGTDLTTPGIFQALQAGLDAPATSLRPLAALIEAVIPLKVLFGSASFATADLVFIQQNPAIFAISDFSALTLAQLRKVSVYSGFAAAVAAAGQTDLTPLQTVLTSFTGGGQFAPTSLPQLALLLNTDQKRLPALLSAVTLPATAPESLLLLQTVASLAKSLGLGGDALTRLLSDAYVDRSQSSDALLGAFRAQLSDPAKFADRFKPFADRIRQRKRDGLTFS
jgi:hypothetical protein